MGADITFYMSDSGVQGLLFPTEGSQWLTAEMVAAKLQESGLQAFFIEPQTLENLLTTQQQLFQPMPIRLLPKAAPKIFIEVSPDTMTAWLTVIAPAHTSGAVVFPDSEEIYQMLAQSGIVAGVQHEVIQHLIENTRWGERIAVAEGVHPENGQDALFEPLVELDAPPSPKLLEDGSVDFHELGVIVTVVQGDILMRRHPPTLGHPGVTVLGDEIPALPGQDIPFALNHTVKISERDPNLLLAAIHGQPTLKPNSYYIRHVLHVESIDLNTGNVDFNGSMVVKKNIELGFTVKVQGDLTVYGNICDANVQVQGRLVVKGGIIGEQSRIKVYGPVQVQFIENAWLECYSTVRVAEAILHSDVTSFGSVQVGFLPGGEHGTVVGGHLRALRKIWARHLGSASGTRTIVEVGTYPYLMEQHQVLQQELVQKQTAFQEVRRNLMNNKGEIHPKVLEYLEDQWQQLELAIELLETSLKQIAGELERQTRSSGRVVVLHTIFAGVQLTINRYKTQQVKRKSFTETTVGATFYLREHQIEQAMMEKHYLDSESFYDAVPAGDESSPA